MNRPTRFHEPTVANMILSNCKTDDELISVLMTWPSWISYIKNPSEKLIAAAKMAKVPDR